MTRALGSFQVAALLVSASYGIGFLFGSGELAIAHGMAGSIYGVATAFGMLVLALFARRLWTVGLPVWGLFGRAFGAQLQGVVALLSLIWMSGVLAAQIQGGVAVLALLGLNEEIGYLTILLLIYGASRLDLRFASAVFATCLLASAAVLVYALVVADGVGLYLRAIPAFTQDLSTFSSSRVVAISLAVGLLVCTGADYQQFVLAASSPGRAVGGCLLAGLLVFVIGFLPSAVVVAMQNDGSLVGLANSKQVVPWVLGQVAGSVGRGADKLMLIALSLAALGAGAAILRAMAEAMVSVNVVYIASVGVCFVAMVTGVVIPPRHARWIMALGFAASVAVYLVGWLGNHGEDADVISLVLGCLLSAGAALWFRVAVGGWSGSFCGLRR
jgi:solute:Na+ symporter, SSS family